MVVDGTLSATLTDLSKVKASAPKGDATIYIVETQPLGWKVNRTFKDFQWLYKCLNGKYPTYYVIAIDQIPTVPKKKAKRTEDESQKERLATLQLFLNQILAGPEFKYSQDLVKFLKEPDTTFKTYSEVIVLDEELWKS